MIMKLMKIIVTILITMMMKIVIGRMISKHSGAVELCILQELVISQWHNQCICFALYLYCIHASYCNAQAAQAMHLLSTVSPKCMHFTVSLLCVHFAVMHILHKQCICSPLYLYCIHAFYCDAQVAQAMHLLSTVTLLYTCLLLQCTSCTTNASALHCISTGCMHFTVSLVCVHFAVMQKLQKQCICLYTVSLLHTCILLQCTSGTTNASALHCIATGYIHFTAMHKLHKQCIYLYTLLQCTASALQNIHNASTLYSIALHLFCAQLKCTLEYFRSVQS